MIFPSTGMILFIPVALLDLLRPAVLRLVLQLSRLLATILTHGQHPPFQVICFAFFLNGPVAGRSRFRGLIHGLHQRFSDSMDRIFINPVVGPVAPFLSLDQSGLSQYPEVLTRPPWAMRDDPPKPPRKGRGSTAGESFETESHPPEP